MMKRSTWSEYAPAAGGLLGTTVVTAVVGVSLWQWLGAPAAVGISVPLFVGGVLGDARSLGRKLVRPRRPAAESSADLVPSAR